MSISNTPSQSRTRSKSGETNSHWPARQEILHTGGSPDLLLPIGLVPPAPWEVLIRCPDFLYLLVSSNPPHSANTTSSQFRYRFPLPGDHSSEIRTPSHTPC
ncbi:hypothetical protein ASPBRDRAFT_44347 [Aspergillus brasiliensis CBS 101740]|uniref:Uncharacterized protein n=1 Tax=Aspergillus brasiliensis (strain CBS 101740 / IMI 381727 / IBT 21946) TaxID=767769 RepID=A0A1L9UIE7_ASPBC|nr:hypothetical protein ASPBRDRAFT_44347 [Aspergillus brasiliensis CBS 101740]